MHLTPDQVPGHCGHPHRQRRKASIALLAAYAGVTVAGALVRQSSETALYVVGAAALLLLYIGIHNAWDSAVFMTIQRQRPKS